MNRDRDDDAPKLTRRELSSLLGAGLVGSLLPTRATAQPSQPAQPDFVPADDLLTAPVERLASALRDGTVSSEELTLAYLRRIESLNPGLNAVVHVVANQAVESARRADRARASGEAAGPLHGVPMTLKDSIDTAGVVTTWGTLGRSRHVPQRDATVAARLKHAGAILLGKTNTPEFTLSFETDNLVYGQTRNPYDRERSPGGSSGGAAAAVAAGLCAFDIGSDTGGSIRVPSHCCGTAGLKPTQGRVPRSGHAVSFGGLHDPLTQLGPIARSVGDLELLLRVIAGPDGQDPFVAPAPLGRSADVPVAELRVAWHADNGMFSPEAAIQATTAEAARALAKTGATLEQAVPPGYPDTPDELEALFAWVADGGAWIQRLLDAAGTRKPHPFIARQINAEWQVDSAELTRLIEQRDAFRAGLLAFMQGYDALLTPVMGFAAPPAGQADSEPYWPGFGYTQVFNLAGLPAVVVRCGTTPEGLPIGVQVAARPWQEHVALAIARRLESDFGGWQAPPTG